MRERGWLDLRSFLLPKFVRCSKVGSVSNPSAAYRLLSVPASFSQGKKISKRDKPCVGEENHGITPYFHSRRKLWENKSFRPSWPLSRAVLASPLTEKQTKGFFSFSEAERRISVNAPTNTRSQSAEACRTSALLPLEKSVKRLQK